MPPFQKMTEGIFLQLRSRRLCFPRRPLIMGIVNINHDSFSGDGKVDVDWAIEYASQQAAEGADIIDIGAESARTNREPISTEEEITRLVPFLKRFREIEKNVSPRDKQQVWPPLLSVNSWRPEVARVALTYDVDILNDMSGLPTDENARICALSETGLLIMHTMGQPKIPHTHIRYENILEEVARFFMGKLVVAEKAGLSSEKIIFDPGLDFAKQGEDNLQLLRNMKTLHALGRPVLLPLSRKSFIGKALGIESPTDRDAATIACVVKAQRDGAAILRVHNVKAVWQSLVTIAAVEAAV